MTFAEFIFVVVNIAIVGGYVYAGVFVAPVLPATSWMTKFWGFWFFFLCGLTHVELATAAWRGHGFNHDIASWHMLLIHVPQAVAIWGFLMGLRRDVILSTVRSAP